MIDDDDGPGRHRSHVLQRRDHEGFGVPCGIHGPGFATTVAAFKVKQVFSLVIRLGNDQAGMFGPGRIELHAVEQDQFRYCVSCLQQLRIGLIGIELRM